MNKQGSPVQAVDREGYYDALHDACAGFKDAEIGYQLLTRVKGVKSKDVSEKDLTTARLHVNHCKNPRRDESFRHAELLVIQQFTGRHSVLEFDCASLGREVPKLIDPHTLYAQMEQQERTLLERLHEIQSNKAEIAPLIADTVPTAQLVQHPGLFEATFVERPLSVRCSSVTNAVTIER